MSYLASSSRAGLARPKYPSFHAPLCSIGTTRCYATVKKQTNVPKNKTPVKASSKFIPKFTTERRGNPEKPRQPTDTGPGAFRALPAARLTHEVFHSGAAPDLPKFSPGTLTPEMIGTAAEFQSKDNDPMQRFGLPKKLLLEFRILSKPYSIIRDVTLSVVEKLAQAKDSFASTVLTGHPGCGKSFLLLQAVEYCKADDWIVIYIPRARNLVNSTTSYSYDIRTQTYLQPAFAHQTLQRMLSVNSAALSSMRTTRAHKIDVKRDVSLGTSLSDLIDIGMKDMTVSCPVLAAVMAELGEQKTRPVLLAIDDFQALYCQTSYRDPHFVHIRPHHLSVPRLLLEYASGKRQFKRGLVLGALTASDHKFPISLQLKEALSLSPPPSSLPGVFGSATAPSFLETADVDLSPSPASPYTKRSRPLGEYLPRGFMRPFHVPERMSIQEAGALFDVWMRDGALVGGWMRPGDGKLEGSSLDEMFMAKYIESSGNPREFVWKGLLENLAT